jgi:hypothetical protein
MENRRLLPRRDCPTTATCHPAPEGDSLGPAVVCDVSAGGVALRVGRPVEPQTLLYLNLDGDGGEASHRLLVQVVRAEEAAGGLWLLGCAFSTALTASELNALVRAAQTQVLA